MQRKVVKIIAFCLLIACFLGVLAGCGKPDEAAFLTEAEALLVKAEAVNALCFGEGLAPEENGYTSGGYTEAAEESLAAYGVKKTADMKAMVREVYSVTVADWVEEVTFSAVYAESTVVAYSRYYDSVASEEEGDRAVLMVKDDYQPLLKGRAVYSHLRVVSLKRNKAEILVDVTVTYGEESRVEKDVSLALRREEQGWRFDTPTYVTFQ